MAPLNVLALLAAAAQLASPCLALEHRSQPLQYLDTATHAAPRLAEGRKLLQSGQASMSIEFYYEPDSTRGADNEAYLKKLMPAAASFLSHSVRVRCWPARRVAC